MGLGPVGEGHGDMSVHEWERGEDEAELLVGEEGVQDDHGDRGARVRPAGRGIKKNKEKWGIHCSMVFGTGGPVPPQRRINGRKIPRCVVGEV